MTFTEKLNDADLKEVRRMLGKWRYRYRSFYGPILLLVFSIDFIRRPTTDWGMVAPLAGIFFAGLLFALYLRRRTSAQRLAKANAMRPDRIMFTNDGVQSEGPNGATSLVPWRSFRNWREGKRVILLERSEGKHFLVLPVG
jgi:YcxB-like protein